MIDASGSQLEQFLTHGIDAETRAEIGALPRGRGILGVLIREAKPLRLHDLAEDPRSVGFPPGASADAQLPRRPGPAARRRLRQPLPHREAGRRGLHRRGRGARRRCSPARLRSRSRTPASTRRRPAGRASSSRWKRSGTRSPPRPTSTGCSISSSAALRELLGARVVALALPSGATSCGSPRWPETSRTSSSATTFSRSASKSGRVLRAPAQRAHRLRDRRSRGEPGGRRGALGARTGMWVPLIARDRVIGVLEIHDKEGADARFSDDDLRLAETFAARAAVAVELSQRVAQRCAAPRRAGAGARAPAARARAPRRDRPGAHLDPARAEAARGRARRPPGARRRGRAARACRRARSRTCAGSRSSCARPCSTTSASSPALERLTESFAEQTGIRVDFHSALGETRLPERGRDGALPSRAGVAHEHRQARRRAQRQRLARPAGVRRRGGDRGRRRRLRPAGDVREDGIGLLGMRERLALLGGRLEIESRKGAGTTIVAEVPLA